MWKAFRDHSVTFAVLLAFALLGVSVLGGLREGLRAMHVPWLFTLLVPGAVIAVLARKEREWIPDAAKRKQLARGIVGVAIVLAMLAAMTTRSLSRPAQESGEGAGQDSTTAPVRPRGPSGK